MTRKQMEDAVWNNTHSDFRGVYEGERTILVFRNGTTLVPLSGLTDKELTDRLPKRRAA